jgi:hypothetical protein
VALPERRIQGRRSDATEYGPVRASVLEGIHLAAMSKRVWDSSLDRPTFDGTGETATSDEVTETVARAAPSSLWHSRTVRDQTRRA